MALNTYADLKNKVASYLNRLGATAITDEVPDFIALAEFMTYRKMRLPVQEVVASLPVAANGRINIPQDFLELRDISWLGPKVVPLTRRPWREVERIADTGVEAAGHPRAWARIGQELQVSPIPDVDNTNVRVVYYQSFIVLSDGNQTNYFTDCAPDVLLFGALYEAAIFMKDAEMEERYKKRFEIALSSIQDEADMLEWGGNGLSGNTVT